jgi:hypothetical protein
MREIDQMPAGAELDMMIETEIFGSIPLTDDEWNLCLAMIEYREPYRRPPDKRMIKVTTAEPTHFMKLMFRLQWPREYSIQSLGDQSRYLVEKMRYDGWQFHFHDSNPEKDKTFKIAQFNKWPEKGGNAIQGEAMAETDALAIARAALKAVRALKSLENT